jgi:hypothetical protein
MRTAPYGHVDPAEIHEPKGGHVMSTKIGTLQAPRTTRSIWPVAVIVSLLLLTAGIGAYFLGRDQAAPTSKTVAGSAQPTVVSGTAANTSTEISGGVAGGFAPSAAGSSWIGVGVTPAMQEAIVAARDAGSSWISVGVTPAMQEAIVAVRDAAAGSGELSAGTNTPSELSGGIGSGLPAKIYDRHQRG